MVDGPQPVRRIRPMMSVREALAMPQVVLYPAALLSLAAVILSLASDELPLATIIGGTAACFIFYALIFVVVIIPMTHARRLGAEGVNGSAIVRTVRSDRRQVGPLNPVQRVDVPTHFVTIEFTPEGATGPLLVELELPRLDARLKVGKTVKIRYARTEPRLLKLDSE